MSISQPEHCVFAVDLGGTKIAAGVVAQSSGQAQVVKEFPPQPTHADEGGPAVLQRLVATITAGVATAKSAGLELKAIGIGAPGVIDSSSGVVLSAGQTMPGWGGQDIRSAVAAATGLPVFVENDVRVLGLGEARFGAGRGVSKNLFVSLGTGIGGALITGGQLELSPHHNAGEIGYLLGPTPQGGWDMIEKIGSGPALAKKYGDGTRDLRQLLAAYAAGETAVGEHLSQSLRCVGLALAGLINTIDVSQVIIGGGVGNLGEVVLAPLKAGLKEHLLPGLKDLPVVQAELGLQAPLVGAASLAWVKTMS